MRQDSQECGGLINQALVLAFLVRVAEYQDDKMMCSMAQMGAIRKWQVQLSP